MSSLKKGVLLINLGTPSRAETREVGAYLKEFLLDPEVIDLPWLWRQILVRFFIVPFRKKNTTALYRSVWTKEGSPLAVLTKSLAQKLSESLPGVSVRYAFRYGQPSFEKVLQNFKKEGVEDLLVLPLYPQYATSATRTTLTALENLKINRLFSRVLFISSFHDQDFFLQSLANKIRADFDEKSHFLFSFHGLPVSHIEKNHPGCENCLTHSSCQKTGEYLCYRRQCTETAEKLAGKLQLKPEQWDLSYQSRLGRAAWLLPSTEEKIPELAHREFENLTVINPGFVIDCLETLEEMDVRGKELYLAHGGKKWTRVACLNSDPDWVLNLSQWIQKQLSEDVHAKTST